jgi:hypothetical protein
MGDVWTPEACHVGSPKIPSATPSRTRLDIGLRKQVNQSGLRTNGQQALDRGSDHRRFALSFQGHSPVPKPTSAVGMTRFPSTCSLGSTRSDMRNRPPTTVLNPVCRRDASTISFCSFGKLNALVLSLVHGGHGKISIPRTLVSPKARPESGAHPITGPMP